MTLVQLLVEFLKDFFREVEDDDHEHNEDVLTL